MPIHTHMADGGGFAALVFILIVVGLFWLPAIIAHRRHHKQRGAITVLNLFGMLGITWIVALVWSATS